MPGFTYERGAHRNPPAPKAYTPEQMAEAVRFAARAHTDLPTHAGLLEAAARFIERSAKMLVGVAEQFTAQDGGKMLTLALWLDLKDDEQGFTGNREVQADLRRWATMIAACALTESQDE